MRNGMKPEAKKKKNPSPYGRREDGTPKGKGYFGFLKRKDGGISTEISVGLDMDGKEVLMPALVPTLSQDEVNYLLNDWEKGTPIPQPILRKAADHAVIRIREGKSPFFD